MALEKTRLWKPRKETGAYARNGMHVMRLRHVSEAARYPWIGYVYELDRECSWRSSGHALATEKPHHLDLVAEWDADAAMLQLDGSANLTLGQEILVRFRVDYIDKDGTPSVIIQGLKWKPTPEMIVGLSRRQRDEV